MQGGEVEVEPGTWGDRAPGATEPGTWGDQGEKAASIPRKGGLEWGALSAVGTPDLCRQAFSDGMMGLIHEKGFKSALCSHRLGMLPTPTSQPGNLMTPGTWGQVHE